MSSQFEHLPLPKINLQLPRRSAGGGGGGGKRDNRPKHGADVLGQIDKLEKASAERKSSFRLDPKLIFKIKIADKFRLSEVDLEKSGLTLLAQEPSVNKAVVVFSSDAQLTELRNRLKSYSGIVTGLQNDYLDAVEEIVPLEPSDRTGRLLELEPLEPEELAALDLEFWHTGDRTEMQRYVNRMREGLSDRSTSNIPCALTDFYIGDYLCVVRIKVNQAILDDLLTEEIVKEIDRRPKVAFEVRAQYNPSLSELPEVVPPDPNACGILVIDSGVQRGHPLLAPVIGEAEVFSDEKQKFISTGADDEADHGTGVAGIAAYGDIETCIRNKSFDPTAWIFSARVLNEHNQFDEDLLVENQLEQAISYFVKAYPNCKVINLSLGNADQVYQEGKKQTRIATKIDELAYRYQQHNILFVISAGNYFPYDYRGERDLFRTEYPNYLLEADARIIDPATSAIAVTVGSLSLGRGGMTHPDDARRNTVAKMPKYPSPFTRTGFGVDGMIKPDLVDFGGDLLLDGDRVAHDNEAAISVVTFSQNYQSSLFKIVKGTSFAAPRVANLAAQLYTKYPTASSNLIRALMVTSAELPQERPSILQDAPKNSTDKQKTTQLKNQLAVYGYGQADIQRAMYSTEDYVVPAIPNSKFSLD
jgi:Subtilase family